MKIVIKIGTSSVIKDGSINYEVVNELTSIISNLMIEGHNIVLVSSGAVGCGKNLLKLYDEGKILLRDDKIVYSKNYSLLEKTLLSGMGQADLIAHYKKEFLKRGILMQQVLLAGKKDIENTHFIDNINECFQYGIISVINANDTVYNKELAEDIYQRFSDNDVLAAEVAKSIAADKLILITNVSGYLNEKGEVVEKIDYHDIEQFLSKTSRNVSNGGTGGMYSKLAVSQIAACDTIIISNSEISNITSVIDNDQKIGTKIKFRKRNLQN